MSSVRPCSGGPAKSIPHTYTDGSLCLHDFSEWRGHMVIADTTLAWTAEWLIHYEIWRATGDWHGGGEWPPGEAVSTKRQPGPDDIYRDNTEKTWETR